MCWKIRNGSIKSLNISYYLLGVMKNSRSGHPLISDVIWGRICVAMIFKRDCSKERPKIRTLVKKL